MKIVKLLGGASEDQAPLTSLRKIIEEFFQPKTMHGLVITTTFKKLSCMQLANLLDMHDCVSKETGVLKEDVDLLVAGSSLGFGVQVSRSDSNETNTPPSSFEVSICRVATVSDGPGPPIGSSLGSSSTGGDIYDIMDEAAFDQVEENHSLLAQAQKEAEAAAREIEDDAILQEVMASSSTTQHKGTTTISIEPSLNQQAKKRSDKKASTEALVTYILENVDLETLFSTAIRPDGQWMSPLEMKAHIIGTYNVQVNLKAAQGILKVLRELKGYNTASHVEGDANIEDDVSMALAMSLSEVPLETRSTDMNEDDQLALAMSLSMAN